MAAPFGVHLDEILLAAAMAAKPCDCKTSQTLTAAAARQLVCCSQHLNADSQL
jgi:hypothetical protein